MQSSRPFLPAITNGHKGLTHCLEGSKLVVIENVKLRPQKVCFKATAIKKFLFVPFQPCVDNFQLPTKMEVLHNQFCV